MPLYREGSVSLTLGSRDVVGTGTEFGQEVAPGDILVVSGALVNNCYEILSIESDTELTLDIEAAETVSGSYVIIRSISTANNLYLMRKIDEFLKDRQRSLVEMVDWISGEPDGGPEADGQFPLTDRFGVTTLAKSPKALEAQFDQAVGDIEDYLIQLGDITDAVNATAQARDDAQEAASDALGHKNAAFDSEQAAALSESHALSHKDDALEAKTQAQTARSDAIDAKDAAALSATSANTSKELAQTAASDALESENAAKSSEIAAANSASLAQSIATLGTTGFPNFRPALHANFANAGMLDPRITFSRPGPTTYIEDGILKTAAANVPVFEDGALRLRPQETNLTSYSRNLELFNPDAGGAFFEPSVMPGPALGSTMMKIVAANTNGLQRIHGNPGFTIEPSTKYTATIYAKAGEAGYLFINFAAALGLSGAINLLTGEVIAGTVTPVTTHLRDGIYRCDLTGVSPASPSSSMYQHIQESFAVGSQYYQGDGVSGLYVSDIQINEGDPIPYIPTEASQVTRAADNLSLQGEAFASVFNASEGAIILDLESTVLGSSMFRLRTAAGVARLYWNNLSSWGLSIGAYGNIALGTLVPGVRKKIAIAWDSTGCSIYRNSALIRTVTPSEFNFSDVAQMDVFNGAGGRIYRPHIFPRRPPDVEMEALTS